jgi:hypothetical protein
MLVLSWNARQRVVGVDKTPVMERSAVVLVRPVIGANRRIKIEPLAFAAVEVLLSSISMRNLSFLGREESGRENVVI